MAEIASVDLIAAKWARVTPQRSADYEAGVQAPRRDWARSATASNAAWKAGVQAAIQADSFSKGVTRVGTARWQEKTLQKGVTRWGPGVQAAQEDYQRGFAPFVEAIRRTTLPPRFARRDPRNLERVRVIVDALAKAKAAQAASSS